MHIDDDLTLYNCKRKVTNNFEETNKPIYNQILLNAHFALYDKWQELGGDLIQIKTDCMIIQDGAVMEASKDFGGFKHERAPDYFKVESRRRVPTATSSKSGIGT